MGRKVRKKKVVTFKKMEKRKEKREKRKERRKEKKGKEKSKEEKGCNLKRCRRKGSKE